MKNRKKTSRNPLVLVLGAVTACLFGGACTLGRGHILDGPGMVNVNAIDYICYYVFGGMEYEHYKLEIWPHEGLLTVEEREEGMSDNYSTYKYKIPASYCDELEALSAEYKMYKWTQLEKDDMEVLDAPGTKFIINFSSGTDIEVRENDIVPGEGYDGIRKVIRLLEDARINPATELLPLEEKNDKE